MDEPILQESEELATYFHKHDLAQFIGLFSEQGYDLETFSKLEAEDLDALKIKQLGHRKQLLLKAEELHHNLHLTTTDTSNLF